MRRQILVDIQTVRSCEKSVRWKSFWYTRTRTDGRTRRR